MISSPLLRIGQDLYLAERLYEFLHLVLAVAALLLLLDYLNYQRQKQ